MSLCVFEYRNKLNGRHCVCVRCGYRSVIESRLLVRICASQTVGAGELLHKILARAGITPPRISRLIGRPCSCSRRAEQLDRLDFRFRRWLWRVLRL
jgi:hypothetical protein